MSELRPRRTVSVAPTRAVTTARKPPSRPLRAWVLDVPFAMRSVAREQGARWDADSKAWIYRGPSLPPGLAPMAAQPWSLEARTEKALNSNLNSLNKGHVAETPPAPRAMTPRPHQQVGIEAIQAAHDAGLGGFLLADDVGLGKTLTAWAAVDSLPELTTVLIVCPLAVVAHWRRTIAAWGDGGRDIVVLNYERLGKLFEVDDDARGKVKSARGLARRGHAEQFDAIIWDESHRLKNPAAARSKFAVKLGAEARFTLWLSATAGQNPLELSYLAPLLARSTGASARSLKDFEAWCAKLDLGVTRAAFGRWDWRGDPEDCERVRGLLFDAGRMGAAAGLRRRPEDIAGWPELNRILTPLALDAEGRALYRVAWEAFRDALARAREGALESGAPATPKGGRRSAGELKALREAASNRLTATLRLRQKASLLRVPGTVDLALELREAGLRVAISVGFIETLEAIAAGLAAEGIRSEVIAGSSGAAEREAARLRFQRGETPVVLFTVEEGISLHQGEHEDVPRALIIHDLRWSAIQMAQIEGRCHRDGRFAQAFWTFAEDTLEESIAGIVCRRIQAMKGMVGDDTETLKEIERLLEENALR
jgi:superfamily II DNA or RNA helicase